MGAYRSFSAFSHARRGHLTKHLYSGISTLALGVFFSVFVLPTAYSSDIGFPEHVFDYIDWPLPTAHPYSSARYFEPVRDLSPNDRYRLAGRPIGRLAMVIRKPDGRKYSTCCTAWLVGNGKLMTNYHCIPTFSSSVLKARLDMGYLRKGSVEESYFVDPNSIERTPNLDYAVLRVSGNPSRRFGAVSLNFRDSSPGEALFVVHHSKCLPQQLTRQNCKVYTGRYQHIGGDLFGIKIPAKNSVKHTCTTLGGSSGSPLFADRDTAVVGLHHATSFDYNLAIKTRPIALRSSLPFRDLDRKQAVPPRKKVSRPTPKVEPKPKLPKGTPSKDGEVEQLLGLSRSDRMEIQRRLRAKGLDPGPIDGKFGRRTRSAIARFQRLNGLEPTGFVNRKTLKLLPESGRGRGLAAILGRPLSPHGVHKNGWSDIHLAAALDFGRDVSDLLNAGADPNMRLPGTRRDSEIYEEWQIQSLNHLGLKADYFGAQYAGQTPLHEAARNGANNALRVLLDKGADLHVRDIDTEYTALHYAAMGNNPDSVRILIDYGIEPDVQGSEAGDYISPSQIAAYHNAREALAALFYRGADPTRKFSTWLFDGETLLHAAAFTDAVSVTKFLLKQGANPESRDSGGRTPVDVAADFGSKGVLEVYRGLGLVLGAGSGSGYSDSDDEDALQY